MNYLPNWNNPGIKIQQADIKSFSSTLEQRNYEKSKVISFYAWSTDAMLSNDGLTVCVWRLKSLKCIS